MRLIGLLVSYVPRKAFVLLIEAVEGESGPRVPEHAPQQDHSDSGLHAILAAPS